MKKSFTALSLAVLLAVMAPAARADLDAFLRSVNVQAQADMGSFSAKLSAQFGVPLGDVQLIVRSVSQPADAFMILQLGKMAHAAPAAVLQKYQRSRSRGRGWGRLAQELGIKPGSREFRALKRGDLAFTGERAESPSAPGRGHGRGRY